MASETLWHQGNETTQLLLIRNTQDCWALGPVELLAADSEYEALIAVIEGPQRTAETRHAERLPSLLPGATPWRVRGITVRYLAPAVEPGVSRRWATVARLIAQGLLREAWCQQDSDVRVHEIGTWDSLEEAHAHAHRWIQQTIPERSREHHSVWYKPLSANE